MNHTTTSALATAATVAMLALGAPGCAATPTTSGASGVVRNDLDLRVPDKKPAALNPLDLVEADAAKGALAGPKLAQVPPPPARPLPPPPARPQMPQQGTTSSSPQPAAPQQQQPRKSRWTAPAPAGDAYSDPQPARGMPAGDAYSEPQAAPQPSTPRQPSRSSSGAVPPPSAVPEPTSPPGDIASPPPPAADSKIPTAAGPAAARKIDGFPDLRHAVLEAIGGARTRVWLTTEYLTDGEVVTALYLAQYRRLDVKVLLGRVKANLPLSRLNYLKQQNVPVYLKPDNFKPGYPTAILTDDQLLYVDGELDSQARARRFVVTQGTAQAAGKFLNEFANAASLEVPALPRPTPLVGRPNPSGSTYNVKYSNDGSYRYDRKAEPRPEGVPNKLPRQTKMQERRQHEESSEPPPLKE